MTGPRAAGAWIAIGTAALCLLTAGGSMTTTDAVVAFDLTQSLVDRGSIATSRDWLGNDAYRGVDGRYYSPFGVAQSVWNVPFYLVGRAAAAQARRPETAAALPKAVVTLGTIPAVALLAWCAFAILLQLGAPARRAFDTAVLLTFSTPLWPYSGFGFNQPLAALLLWSAVLTALHARDGRPPAAFATGSLLGLSILTRQEMVLAAPLLMAYAAPGGRRANALRVAAGFAPFLAVWGGYNYVRFGSPLQSGYLRDQTVGFGGSLLDGAAGLLFSPYASIFLYCPIVILAIPAMRAAWRRDRATGGLWMAMLAAFFLLYASIGNWMGGRAYGPRYLVPLLPALVLPFAWWQPSSRLARVATHVVVVLSIAVQVPGVLVDYAKVRVSLARAGETVAQDMRWSRAPLLLNARAAAAVVPGAVAALVGARPIERVPAGANLNEALASSPDLWWNSLVRIGAIGRGAALAIAGALLGIAGVAFSRGRRAAALIRPATSGAAP